MRTKKINVFEEQRRWMIWHSEARADIVCEGRSGRVVKAVYTSPLEKWRGLIAPDGTVEVPDMDFYNTLTDPEEIKAAVEDINKSIG